MFLKDYTKLAKNILRLLCNSNFKDGLPPPHHWDHNTCLQCLGLLLAHLCQSSKLPLHHDTLTRYTKLDGSGLQDWKIVAVKCSGLVLMSQTIDDGQLWLSNQNLTLNVYHWPYLILLFQLSEYCCYNVSSPKITSNGRTFLGMGMGKNFQFNFVLTNYKTDCFYGTPWLKTLVCSFNIGW